MLPARAAEREKISLSLKYDHRTLRVLCLEEQERTGRGGALEIFRRYAPFIQDFIYENGWENLRAIQVAAGDAIFNSEDNVLLSASTASGKTEAAFFPILTLLEEDPPSSVGVVYIGPLKALINDQFLRLNELCEEAHPYSKGKKSSSGKEMVDA